MFVDCGGLGDFIDFEDLLFLGFWWFDVSGVGRDVWFGIRQKFGEIVGLGIFLG